MNTVIKTKIALLNRGLKPADVAAGTGLRLGYVYNLLSGHVSTRAGRKKIEKFLGVSLWPGSKTEQRRSECMGEQTNQRFSQGAAAEALAGQSPLDPAHVNTSLEWVDGICAKIGFTVVAVQAPYSPELWENSGFEKGLGAALVAVNLGYYDSAKWFNPISFFFYLHTQSLAAGLQLIKARLAAIGLLPHVKIAYADLESKTWRIFYPELERAGS